MQAVDDTYVNPNLNPSLMEEIIDIIAIIFGEVVVERYTDEKKAVVFDVIGHGSIKFIFGGEMPIYDRESPAEAIFQLIEEKYYILCISLQP